MKKRKLNKIERNLGIPKELITNNYKITIIGFEEIYIENYKGILEYDDYFIKISTHLGLINVNGFNLKLNEMTDDDIYIEGKIDTISFEEDG